MAATELARIRLPTTGDQVVVPPLAETGRFEYRVVLEGVLRFAYTDEELDALYRAGRPDDPAAPAEDALLRELDAEVAAIDEVARDCSTLHQ